MTSYQLFKKKIWDFYYVRRRDFVWRRPPYDPYKILISEVMLQQTQTERVVKKFDQFIKRFSRINDLAQASFGEVLFYWNGLGYNRRALALHACAKKIVHDFGGFVPQQQDILRMLPGIGPNTAGSICAFAYNQPVLFIETNIRAVYIHTFFSERDAVSDKELFPLIKDTLDHVKPREWYYALMDYGVEIKKIFKNPNTKSKHYTRQSSFKGSNRQIRSEILKLLLDHGRLSYNNFFDLIAKEPKKIEKNLYALRDEGFICQYYNDFIIAS